MTAAPHQQVPDLDDAIADLRAARDAWRREDGGRHSVAHFPSRIEAERAIGDLVVALFPGRLGGYAGDSAGEDAFVDSALRRALTILQRQVTSELAYWQEESAQVFDPSQPAMIVRLFVAELGPIREMVDADVRAAFLGDPAARSVDEILICYPGVTAILHHRLAHELDSLGAPIVARIVSEVANERTGIDIHPGATIGPGFFIDHGTGVVIGETAVIGARVRLYQHVTLGARTPHRSQPREATGPFAERIPRHPIVGDDVVIYAGATILGRVKIGDRAVIGGNVWLLQDVAPRSVIVQPEAVAAS